MQDLTNSENISKVLARTKIISSDSHVSEPPGVWSSLKSTLGDRAPHLVAEADGDWWYVDRKKTMSPLGINVGQRFHVDSHQLRTSGFFSEVPAGASDPYEMLKDCEKDGVWGTVLYPSQGLVLYSIPDSDLITKCMSTYNDWMAEFCSAAPDRIKGLAMINLDDIDGAIEELKRARKKGLAGALITVGPPDWANYRQPEYDRFWAVAEDLAMPLSLHVGTDRADLRKGDEGFKLDVKSVPPSRYVNNDMRVRTTMADLIFSGVFERFPKLMIGAVEFELCWIAAFLQRLDYAYSYRPPRGPEWVKFKDRNILPSDYFRSNVFVSFNQDPYGLALKHVIGADWIMWGNDYPHTESTFPKSMEILSNIMSPLNEAEIEAVVSGNVTRLYGF